MIWVIAFAIAVAAVTIVLLMFPGQVTTTSLINALAGAFAFAMAILISVLAGMIVVKMAMGTIDLKYLIAEQDGSASLSRFQMLLFTFVIAALYFLYALYTLFTLKTGQSIAQCPANAADLLAAITKLGEAVKTGDTTSAAATVAQSAAKAVGSACSNAINLPDIPGSVLGLMGISGGSYLLSKGIQTASDANSANSAAAAGTAVRKNIQ